MDKVKQVSWAFLRRHLLLLSLTLNLSLLSRFVYERGILPETTDHRPHQEELCFEKEIINPVCGASEQEAHVSRSSTHSSSRAQAADGGNKVINLDHGDPTMYEEYWRRMGEKSRIVMRGWDSMSYFSDLENLCWFLEPEFAKQITRLHGSVGNAVTHDRHIVVGTGSTQLFQAALYALSLLPSPHASPQQPISVVSAVPYYSSYPSVTDYLKSGLYKWEGDAYTFTKEEPYIELVTSPNNPDGFIRQPVVNRSRGIVVYDLAYYWPQYTPITSAADHDLMLFTFSKITGHAGTRMGWALVKDKEVARKMTEFIVLNTIGVSKDSQLRAAKILQVVSDGSEHMGFPEDADSFFLYAYHQMTLRWERLRDAVRHSGLFSLPEFLAQFCNYNGGFTEPHPAFAWLKCKGDIEDCESFLREHKIITRSGRHFGMEAKYVRISMLDRDEKFNLFMERLSNISL
ncbi:L-tryptophan--pyruvate aminotransferase 1-like [Macadamia integrifolia]|uniref:L-tryptophan--pyruvate aminotransferase 1-like n=1 Tax=Macadamia integrifolia TaxID=60698 RepID=UPI001C4FDDEE|nr:L-tryptophan--pyruvate aminotransferase 1-like [Macadamia integrifolia]XP_042498918.1 L-tryptophan--pyruvate aminotransferase 1-like [Macadamia integrifolia]